MATLKRTMRAGKRRHLVQIQRKVVQQDPDYGGTTGTAEWVTIATAWAERTNLLRPAADAVLGGGEVAMETVRWDMLPRDIDPSDRFVHAGKIYDIKVGGISNENSQMSVITVVGANHG